MPDEEGELVIRVTAMPTDLNPYGGVFGGWLMCQLALGASSFVTRQTGLKAVVVGATDFAFPGAMTVGDELNVYARIERVGRTSMTVATRGLGRARASEVHTDVASGLFTFVVLDGNDRPCAIEDALSTSVA
ncbi:acyl-CoA thioesterase [Novosphingobium mangrovi (ex Huang et al. 2023)]|uniref:Acyl-CoA thioesterase n=1 Tax=Novosphingobium mangrovi (ex Huang et al. 2023) TaxID=2976432 RepID=A0ABT2IAM7_9SPHN|nr:hotdog domain-containing protein [Novosphingobium mangrovi (ex Huang et al. 2023)]MCT2401881.1 acyl-CoA thioesterase [Novosphingobium mangrovi (ex Huang et al. 2023)]